jgi:hypothetical protein
LRATLTALLVAVAAAWIAPAALADGDPASDVLAQQSLFLPQDAGVPARQQRQLAALLQEAAHRGYRIRVALIGSSADLGSITELWGQPLNYAKFLGQELGLVYHGPLLVVMPQGAGLYQVGQSDAAGASGLTVRPSPALGGGLGAVALTAIQRLAGLSGHPLSIPNPSAQANPGTTDPTPWIVFAIGGVLIALAWTASLRARPPRLGRRTAASA